jgi:hypothetical protein
MDSYHIGADACKSRFAQITGELGNYGLYCFPLALIAEPDGRVRKQPLDNWKEYQQRAPSEEKIAEWIRRFPDAGAAIPTGPYTKVLGVDADSIGAIEWLEQRGMPETWLTRTPRGLHYYLRYPRTEYPIRNSVGEIAPGVDIRGYGGMLIAAGTRRPDGFVYRWDPGHSPADLLLADPPQWLLKTLAAHEQKKQPVAAQCELRAYTGKTSAWARKAFQANLDELSAASEGTRNAAIWKCSRRLGQLCAGGALNKAEVEPRLGAIIESWDNVEHSRDTMLRALKAGAITPRSAPTRHLVTVEVV